MCYKTYFLNIFSVSSTLSQNLVVLGLFGNSPFFSTIPDFYGIYSTFRQEIPNVVERIDKIKDNYKIE